MMIGSRAIRRSLVSSLNKVATTYSNGGSVGVQRGTFIASKFNNNSFASLSSITSQSSPFGLLSNNSNNKRRFYSTDNNTVAAASASTSPSSASTVDLLPIQEKAIEAVVNSTSDISVGSVLNPEITIPVEQPNPIVDAVVNFNNGIVEAINNFSVSTGCPWWLCIAGITVGLRILILPMTIKQQHSAANAAIAKEEMEKYSYLNDGTTDGRLKFFTKSREIQMKHGANPLRMLLIGLSQVPAYIYVFYLVRSACTDFPQFVQNGGALWFKNLAEMDPNYILPVASSVFQFISMRLSFTEQTPLIMKIVFGALCIVPLYFTYAFPAGLNVYWCMNSLLFVAQNWLFKKPAVKRFFNIPIHNPSASAAKAEIRVAPEVVKKSSPEAIFSTSIEEKSKRLEKLKLEVKDKKESILNRRK